MKESKFDYRLPDAVENVSMGDIPWKYFQPMTQYPTFGSSIDATFSDFQKAHHLIRTVKEREASAYKMKINELFVTNKAKEASLVTLSVRSAWDLYFQVKQFPRGSEVLFTGITIPDMTRIAEEHGLVCVPVDLDPNTIQPSLDQIEAATSEKTVAMIFAYLFGCTYDLAPYVPFLKSRNIDILEDCAQSFKSLDIFKGCQNATMTMFSFGMIKHNTAFYGAVSIIREDNNLAGMPKATGLHKQMAWIQEQYQLLPLSVYKKRVMTAFAAWSLTTKEPILAAALKYCKLRGKDLQDEVISALRGFAADDEFLAKFRIKPCAALCAMIHHRTSNYSAADFRAMTTNYHKMTKALVDRGYLVPGWAHIENRSFWLYPFPVANSV